MVAIGEELRKDQTGLITCGIWGGYQRGSSACVGHAIKAAISPQENDAVAIPGRATNGVTVTDFLWRAPCDRNLL